MRYENGWIFADGRFVRGGFSVENGRFAHVLEDVPGPAEDLDGALVIPGLVEGSKNKHRQLYEALLQRNKREALAVYEAHTSTILGRFFTLASESYSTEEEKEE